MAAASAVVVGAKAIRSQNTLPVACAVRVNSRRKALEDCASVHRFYLGKHKVCVYALFDGHGISDPKTPHVASSYAAVALPQQFASLLTKSFKNAPKNLAASKSTTDLPPAMVKQAIRDAYWAVEAQMEAGGPERNRRLYEEQGTTAVLLAIVDDKQLFVSNAGDSRAMLVRCSAKPARSLTLDHKPYTVIKDINGTGIEIANEPRRLLSAGHLVSMRDDDDQKGRIALMRSMFPRTAVSDDYRIMVLAEGAEPRTNVSRGLGDLTASKPRSRDLYAVTPEPFITMHNIEYDYCYMVIASDGLFDVMTNAEVAALVDKEIDDCLKPEARYSQGQRKCTIGDRKVAQRASEKLARTARERGSSDDITVMIVPFK